MVACGNYVGGADGLGTGLSGNFYGLEREAVDSAQVATAHFIDSLV
jgi:hypothetical protein